MKNKILGLPKAAVIVIGIVITALFLVLMNLVGGVVAHLTSITDSYTLQLIADFYVGAARIRAEPDICDRYCSVFGLSKGAAGGNFKGYERQNCGGEVTPLLFYASNLHL